MVASATKRGKRAVSQLDALEYRANELFNAIHRIATKVFTDDELEDACRDVNFSDTQLWLKPPPMPQTTNYSVVLKTARGAGRQIIEELRARINSATLDSAVIAWALDGLAGIVQDLQDTEATGFAISYEVTFYEIVVVGYESALAPLIRRAEEAGL